ncbi:MAG TPA: outer membrane lipoprotein-sorting protein [Pseudomonadales bacterium]
MCLRNLALAVGLIAAAAASADAPPGEAPLPDLSGMTPEEQGLTIFRAKDSRESGYGDLQVELEMILRDRRGTESRRELSISQVEMERDGDRLLVVFDTPKPIRGTALLSHSHLQGPDDQWLYLPSMSRVKKIASRNRSGPFLGSEFAYEDLALDDVEKFSYRLMGSERCGEADCLRIERVPHDEFSGYSRQEVLLHEPTLRVERIDYFDRHGRPLKVLTSDGYRLYEDRYWKAHRMFMENLQTGKTTELLWKDYRFATGLDAERDFSTNALMRAR